MRGYKKIRSHMSETNLLERLLSIEQVPAIKGPENQSAPGA